MKKFVLIILALLISIYLFSYAEEEHFTKTAPKVPPETETAIPRPLTELKTAGVEPSSPLEVRDARVKDIQNALMIVGYYKGSIDGKMGPLTKKAIKDFQRDKNLQVDGKIGPQTWGELRLYLNDLMAKRGCLSIYKEIYKIMNDEYYKDVSREKFEKFINTVFQNNVLQQNELDYFRYKIPAILVKWLKDPQDNYSYFYVGEEAKKIEKIAFAYEESLGIDGRLIDKGFKVTWVEPRSDSFEKGLRKNDNIIKINHEFVKNLTEDQIKNKLLKAEPNTKVNLRIISHQDNQEKLLEDVICKKFDKKTSFLIPTRKSRIFCIQIKCFNKMIFDDLNEILDDLRGKRISGIILDFRNNIGGMLGFQDNKGEMIYIIENLAGYFIPPGKRLYYIKTKSPGPKEFSSKEPYPNYSGLFYNVPLIGLMNNGTASTAELILKVLKFYNRITLVGQKSQGAGYIKNIKSGYTGDKKMPFTFMLLISVFYLPDGSTFYKEGLKPDYEILDNEQAFSKAVDILIKQRQRKHKVVY